ncbi:MAG TPA: hypothetical protein VF776_00770 [Sphingomicrobium sp.]
MSSAPTSEEIARDACWLAQALDPSAGKVRLVAMNRDSYRAASFLDDRLMQSQVDAHILPWRQVEDAIAVAMRRDARWIFHIGHVGSTLVSRLLGEIDNVLAVREPRILRDLAMSPPEIRQSYLARIPQLMSRTFSAGQVACIKATSLVSEIAPELVPSGERALFLYATPANYIGSILAGENSVKELRMLAPIRAQRLERRVTGFDRAANDADLAAFAWACEMSALEAAATRMSDRKIEWLDFDRALDDMEAALQRLALSFGFVFDSVRIQAIARGPLMTRYSKDTSYDYSPQLRRDLIDEARMLDRQNIAGALDKLRRAAEKSPVLARALARSGEF